MSWPCRRAYANRRTGAIAQKACVLGSGRQTLRAVGRAVTHLRGSRRRDSTAARKFEKGQSVTEKQVAEIEALMQQHDARTGKRAADQRAGEEFVVEFCRLRREVIKPAMEQVVEKLKAGSHHAAIGETSPSRAQSRKQI